MVDPTDHVIDPSANAGARVVVSVISTIIVFITPTFALRAPQIHRLTTSIQNVRSPKQIMDEVIPNKPTWMTGFLPMRSDRRDH